MAVAKQQTPADILRHNREQAQRMAIKVGRARTLKLLQKAEAELVKRLRGMGAQKDDEPFTAVQLRTTLAHLRHVLGDLKGGMKSTILGLGKVRAEEESSELLAYLERSEKRFKGVNQTLGLDQAAIVDRAVAGTEASVLRRIATDPHHPAQPGVLDRYGVNVIGKFEDELQLRVMTRKPWAEVRQSLIDKSSFLQGAPMSWAERIVRTEVMAANNASGFETMKAADEELDGMVKILCATFDTRTSADSYAVHGQIRRVTEPFDTWQGQVMYPPARPNDREVPVPHRLEWPLPANLKPKSDGEVRARWAAEGRKGSPPPRPKLSTVTLSKTEPGKVEPVEAKPAERVEEPKQTTPAVPPTTVAFSPSRRFFAQAEENALAVEGDPKVYDNIFPRNGPDVLAMEKMWSGPSHGIKTNWATFQKSNPDYGDASTMLVDGKILDGDGRKIGDIQRMFARHKDGTLEVNHTYFVINDSSKMGGGAGTEMMRRSLTAYDEMGVDKVTVSTAWMGRYVWASMGYDWDEATADRMEGRLAGYLVRHGVAESEAAAVAAFASRHSFQVAALNLPGVTRQFSAAELHSISGADGKPPKTDPPPMPIGKAFLLEAAGGWKGSIELSKKSSKSYQRAASKLGLKAGNK